MLAARWCRLGGAVFAFALLAFAATFAAPSAYSDFAVYPSRVEVSAKQGETVTFEIMAATTSADNPMQVVVSAWDFARDQRGEPKPIAPDDAERFHGCSSWLTWLPPSTMLQPGDEVTHTFSASIPADAKDGTHYCYVTFSAMPQIDPAENPESGQAMRTSLGYAISALVLISVGEGPDAPSLVASARAEEFDVRLFNFGEKIPMSVTLVNTGNVHLNMGETSRIEVTKGRHKEADIGLKPYTLLPENTLVIPAAWEPPEVGVYRATLYTDVGLAEPLVADKLFFVLSWPLIIAIAAGLVLFALGAWHFFSRYKIRLAPVEPE